MLRMPSLQYLEILLKRLALHYKLNMFHHLTLKSDFVDNSATNKQTNGAENVISVAEVMTQRTEKMKENQRTQTNSFVYPHRIRLAG